MSFGTLKELLRKQTNLTRQQEKVAKRWRKRCYFPQWSCTWWLFSLTNGCMWVSVCVCGYVCVFSPSCAEALCYWSLPRHCWWQLFPPSLPLSPFNPSSPPAPSTLFHCLWVILWPLFISLMSLLTFVHSSSHWAWSCSSCCSSRAESPAATHWDRSVFMVANSVNPLAKCCRESSGSCITHTRAQKL